MTALSSHTGGLLSEEKERDKGAQDGSNFHRKDQGTSPEEADFHKGPEFKEIFTRSGGILQQLTRPVWEDGPTVLVEITNLEG